MIDLTKTYRTRDGRPVTDLRHVGDSVYPIDGTVDGNRLSYTENGNYWEDGEASHNDLTPVAAETPSWAFAVSPDAVLAGAAGLHSIAIVGINDEGAVVVASSTGTPQTLNLLAQARDRIAANTL